MRIEPIPGKKYEPEAEKRCYLPFVLNSECPHCGERVELNLSRDYLSYLQFGIPYEVYFSHFIEADGKTHEWSVIIQADVSVTIKELETKGTK